jgi:hypothetical protein
VEPSAWLADALDGTRSTNEWTPRRAGQEGRIGSRAFEDGRSPADGGRLVGAEDARARQRRTRQAARHIVLEESPIERERRAPGQWRLVGLYVEAA